VNEITNKTFILDSHRPSICSAKFIIPFRNTCLVIGSKVSLISLREFKVCKLDYTVCMLNSREAQWNRSGISAGGS
jgi:hypothetical protein